MPSAAATRGSDSALARRSSGRILLAMKAWKKISALAALSMGWVLEGPVTCNSILEPSKHPQDDGYVYVTPTGSIAPQRVKKGEDAVMSSELNSTTAVGFSQMPLGNVKTPRSGGGGGP